MQHSRQATPSVEYALDATGDVLPAQTGKGKHRSLGAAKAAKKDEFYTQLPDIENELRHYKAHFAGKTVYLNCDDPRESNFFRYFWLNFEHLGLKRLIATSYAGGLNGQAVFCDYEGRKNGQNALDPSLVEVRPLDGDGDFRSPESIALLQQADIVVTNPPFSLFREYVAQLVEHDKQFLIIGNLNAISYKETFALIAGGRLWLGVTRTGTGQMWFRVTDDAPIKTGQRVDENGVRYQTVGNSAWFTNMDFPKRHEDLPLYRNYTAADYPPYDNYNAINVNKIADIPADYMGEMGVPITFLGKWNPDQFAVLDILRKPEQTAIAGKPVYARIVIARKGTP